MAASLERISEILSFRTANGVESTLKHFGISSETLSRYERFAKAEGIIPKEFKIPKILLFDLETSPLETYTWGVYTQFINPDFVIKDTALLTWAAKWLCQDEVFTGKVSTREATGRVDKSIIKPLWNLIDEADIIIAHNVRRFDEKVANTRFILNGLLPPSPYRTIDTLLEIKKQFRFTSNKLDYVNKKLGIGRKIETSFNLWRRCVNGDADALEEMLTYNIQDVMALEELYFAIRGWIKCHPNLALYYDDCNGMCSNCGSKNLDRGDKYYTTNANQYRAVRCNDCGAWMREKKNVTSKENKIDILRSIAR